ncbi:HU family DNA-binding protein [Flavobacterium sp. XGLA_31]|uniref:HU family DNA-binding protein n=1 Tax=Flavobacterium sp. XGLA_31 TaxID=3447666 RepID=UPI003F4162E6
MAITITPIGKTHPTQPGLDMTYYPKAIKTGEIDLDALSEQISNDTTVTQADCYAVIIGLVKAVSQELEAGKIVRVSHLGSFQISVKGTGSATAAAVAPKNVTSASIIFRPGKKFQAMLKRLKFVRKA